MSDRISVDAVVVQSCVLEICQHFNLSKHLMWTLIERFSTAKKKSQTWINFWESNAGQIRLLFTISTQRICKMSKVPALSLFLRHMQNSEKEAIRMHMSFTKSVYAVPDSYPQNFRREVPRLYQRKVRSQSLYICFQTKRKQPMINAWHRLITVIENFVYLDSLVFCN